MSKIVIFGPDGGGKSTLARALTPDIITSYAAPIKHIAHSEIGREPISREDKEENFRELYRYIGERAKELHGEDVWVDMMDFSHENMVVDDGRFKVEFDNLPNDVVTVYLNMTDADESTCEVSPWECDYYLNSVNADDYEAFVEAFKMEHVEQSTSKTVYALAWIILITGVCTLAWMLMEALKFLVGLFV